MLPERPRSNPNPRTGGWIVKLKYISIMKSRSAMTATLILLQVTWVNLGQVVCEQISTRGLQMQAEQSNIK